MSAPNWTIAWGDEHHFEIIPAVPGNREKAGTHEAMNGIWSTRTAAAEQVIAQLGHAKRRAAHNIARARAIVRRDNAKRGGAA